jgi:CelD/BcsL family acetyltransferase involved in cellulose biosynthesis
MNINPLTRTALHVTRIETPEGLQSIAREWDELASACIPQTPFLTRRWNALWWTHLRRRTAASNDRFFHHIVRDDCGRLIAVAPLMLTKSPGIGLPLARIIQFLGADASLTEVRGLICRERDEERVVVALMRHFLATPGTWDIIRWTGLRTPASRFEPMVEGCQIQDRPPLPDYLLDMPADWDAMMARVSTKMRTNLRRREKILARDGFSHHMRVVTDPAALEPAISTFLRLHAARSAVEDMIHHPNRFGQDPERGFVTAVLHAWARENELRLFELQIGDVTVASRVGFMSGDDLFLYYAGYDPAWRQYSVMTILMAEILRWAIRQGIPRVNLSTGNDQSKTRWNPAEILFHQGVQIAPTARGRLGHRILERAERALRGTPAPSSD